MKVGHGVQNVKIYLVGGAVRDMLLNLPVKDKDWLVVGSTKEEMLNAGYQQVGKNFPVFLHPESREEYALARNEHKSGFGYTGFTCYFAPDVTLEQDLKRRDLTINAMAKTDDGKIIDPYDGQVDLKNCVLRHISSAFSEDPLRVLRVARFAARYAHLRFHVADETLALMKNMVDLGDLSFLTPERIWKETELALSTQNPQVYFQVLRNCGALRVLFPEIDILFNIPALEKRRTENNSGTHALTTIRIAAMLSSSVNIRFAALCHNISRSFLSRQFCSHNKFFNKNIKKIERLCQRLRIPNEICNLAKLAAKFYYFVDSFQTLNPKTIVKLFNNIDAWRKPQRIEQIALISEAHVRGYYGLKDIDYRQGRLFREAWKVVSAVPTKSIIEAGFKGLKLHEELMKRRIQAVAEWKKKHYY